jgi:hypothetical protein
MCYISIGVSFKNADLQKGEKGNKKKKLGIEARPLKARKHSTQ